MGSGSIFLIFDLKKYRFQGLNFLSNNFLIVVWGVLLEDSSTHGQGLGARSAGQCAQALTVCG